MKKSSVRALLAGLGIGLAFAVGFGGTRILSLSEKLGPVQRQTEANAVAARTGDQKKSVAQPPVTSAPSIQSLNDADAKDLALRAASGEGQSLTRLKDAAHNSVPAAEYGLGLYYETMARATSLRGGAFDPCMPTTRWLIAHVHVPPAEVRAFKKVNQSNERHEQLCGNAMSWLQKAASIHDHAAQAELGRAFNGNALLTYMFALSLDKGDPNESEELSHLRVQEEPICRRALAWLKQAAAAHQASAETNLAMVYAGAGHADPCVPEASRPREQYWLIRAAGDGSGSADAVLADQYRREGRTIEANKYLNEAENKASFGHDIAHRIGAATEIAVYFQTWQPQSDRYRQWMDYAKSLTTQEETQYPVEKLIDQKQARWLSKARHP